MADQEVPRWEWVDGLETDYLPYEAQSLVRQIGALTYLYGRSVDEASTLWGNVNLAKLNNRDNAIELALADLKKSDTTTGTELITTLVLSAALSTGIGLAVSAIAAGTAGLARSVLSYHKAAKRVFPAGAVYADVRQSVSLVAKFEDEVALSRRLLEAKPYYKQLGKAIDLQKQSKGVAVKYLSAHVKGELTSEKDADVSSRKTAVGERTIRELIDEHWDGLFASVRTARLDLDHLLRKYKELHEWGLLDESFGDEILDALQNPTSPPLFRSIRDLLPKVLPELRVPLGTMASEEPLGSKESNDLREKLRDIGKDRFAHIFVFQLSGFVFTHETISNAVDFVDYVPLGRIGVVQWAGKDRGVKLPGGEFEAAYMVNGSGPATSKVSWKSSEFKALMKALLKQLRAFDDFDRFYADHAISNVTVGEERRIGVREGLSTAGTSMTAPNHYVRYTSLVPVPKEDAELAYAFLLFVFHLFQSRTSLWSSGLAAPASIDYGIVGHARRLNPFPQ